MMIPEQRADEPKRYSKDFTLPFFLIRTTQVSIISHLYRQTVIEEDVYANEGEWDLYKTRVHKKVCLLPFTNDAEWPSKELKALILPISKHFRTALTVFLQISPKTRNGTPRCYHSDILRWVQISPLGTVDFRRSARAIVDAGVVNDMERYRIARLFCLDDIIVSSWNALNQARRDYLCKLKSFGMGCPKDRLYEYYTMYERGPMGFSNYICAAQDLNETALRHIFSVKIPRLDFATGVFVTSNWNSTFPVQCVPDVYLFLMACYPNNHYLHKSLTALSMFLFHLFEWPYLDVIMNVVMTIDRRYRHHRLHSLIKLITRPSSEGHITGSLYFGTFEKLWNVMLDADFYRFTSLPELGCDVLQVVFLSGRSLGGNIVSLISLMLKGVSQERKERLCSDIAAKINTILVNDLVWGLDHLFQACLTKKRIDQYKSEFLHSRMLNETCWILIDDDDKKIRQIVTKFWAWCGLDGFGIGRMRWQLSCMVKQGDL